MVCVTLRFFASGSFLYSVGDAENLNKGTICRTIRHALKSLVHILITFPGHRRPLYIEEEFYKIAAFPNVICAVDCTHIRIKRHSGEHEGDHINRKSFHSINVQMICDADCLVSNLVAKWPGSVHDSRVFRASPVYERLTQEYKMSCLERLPGDDQAGSSHERLDELQIVQPGVEYVRAGQRRRGYI